MKKKVNFLFALATAGLLWTGCSNETDELVPNPGPDAGEKSLISLTIKNGIATRSSEGNTQGTDGNESSVTTGDGLKVAVFNANGTLDKATSVSLNADGSNYKSGEFEVTVGDKYFFVFANDGANKITLPTAAMTMSEFMKRTVAVALDADAYPTELTNAGSKFLLGTLWAETIAAPAGGTTGDAKTVALTIGRLASKVKLSNIVYTSKGADLLGDFSDAKYRLGSVPKKINYVGVHTGNTLPTATTSSTGVEVISAVHNAAYWTTAGGNANYYDYNLTDWDTKALAPSVDADGDPITNFFYTVENTSGLDNDIQRYGNTSFIQFQTIYTPDEDEILDPATLAKYSGTLTNNTFWRVRVKADAATATALAGKWVIVGVDPTSVTLHTDIEAMSAYPQYTEGKNYHKFAIFDTKESDEVCKNRVLRNHFYQFNVTKFNDLGSHTDVVDPKEPIPNTTTVDVEVTVKDWDKVTTGNVEV